MVLLFTYCFRFCWTKPRNHWSDWTVCTYIRPVSLWGGKAGNNLLCGVMKLAEAVTPAANDVYGPSSLCMYNAIQRRAKPKHDVHHRALKFSQTRIMLTLAQIWKDRGREEREEKRLHRPPSLQKKGRQRASRKKSPISRMKRGEERERQEKFPFCLSSFTAFTPRRRPLSLRRSLSRGPLSSFLASSDDEEKTVQVARTHFFIFIFSQQARTAQNQSLNPETSGNLNS